MLITIFLFSVAIGFLIGYFINRYRINKMVNQMIQLENQKHLLQTRHIINL